MEVVEEACVTLKCAAVKTDFPPYISARLVLVDGPDLDCNGGGV